MYTTLNGRATITVKVKQQKSEALRSKLQRIPDWIRIPDSKGLIPGNML